MILSFVSQQAILTGILILSLYEVSKKLLDKGFDAAWEPVGDSLKDRFKRWAGTDEESKRQTTFAVLVEVARERTILKIGNSTQTKTILQTFDQTTNKQLAVKLAEESGKLILLSDEPDIDQMVSVTQKHLRFEAVFENLDIPSKEIIAVVFTSFLVELRNLLLDEHLSLGEKEVLIELRKIVSHLQPEINDLTALENEYLTKITEKYKYLTMQGISPRIQNRTIGIRMEDVFISLDAVADDSLQEISRVLKMVQTWLVQYGGRTKADINQVPANIIFDQVCEEGGIDHLYYYIGQGYYGYVDLIMEIGSLDSEDYTWEFYDEVTINMDSLVSYPHIVVQGDPGSGKSTLTRYLAWTLAQNRSEKAWLPVRIRAIEFGDELANGNVNSLESYLYREAGRFKPLLEFNLLIGGVLLLIDGLDEIKEVKLSLRVKEEVEDFVTDPIFTENHILITTRIVGYERSGYTGQFPHFTLKELNMIQISNFVEDWYQAIYDEVPETLDITDEKDQLLDSIMSNQSILRMARNPLLLTIIALIKWQGRALPDQRVLLYDIAAKTLIHSWPLTQRFVELDELFIREWLAPVALHVFRDGTMDLIDEYTLQELLVKSMQNLRALTKSEARSQSQALLESVSLHSGILLPRGTDGDGRILYGFLHQTFAEYLTAFYLAGLWEDGELDLIDYAHVPYWHEVVLLVAGYLGIQRRAKAGKFIKAILELNSSPYENHIYQDLLLSCRILADGVPVGPSVLVENIINRSLEIWGTTQIDLLRKDVENVLIDFHGTEYEEILIRFALDSDLSVRNLLSLGKKLDSSSSKRLFDELLHGEDASVRYEVALWFAEKDDYELDAMIGLLEDENIEIRCDAAIWLAKRDDEFLRNTMFGLLNHEDADMRYAAISWISRLDEDSLIELMRSMLVDEDSEIRCISAIWLADRGEKESEAVIVSLLQDEDSDVRYEAAKWLVERGDNRGFDVMMDLLQDPTMRSSVVEYLERHDDKILKESILYLFLNEAFSIRSFAFRWLNKQDDPSIVNTMIGLLDHDDSDVRYKAIQWLGVQEDSSLVELMIKLLHHSDINISYGAVRWLAEEDDGQLIDTMVDLFQHDDLDTRFEAAKWVINQDYEKGIEEVLRLLKEENSDIRYKAVKLLIEQNDKKRLELVIGLLNDNDAEVRLEAIKWIVDQDDEQLMDTMIELLQHNDENVRFGSVCWLVAQGNPQLTEFMINLLNDEIWIRYEAAKYLFEHDNEKGLETILYLLEEKDVDVRFEAVRWLCNNHSQILLENEDLICNLLKDIEEPNYSFQRRINNIKPSMRLPLFKRKKISRRRSSRRSSRRRSRRRSRSRGNSVADLIYQLLLKQEKYTSYPS